MISDKELKKLWLDKNFSGSFSSAHIFKNSIEYEKGEKIPLSRIYRVLSDIEDFQDQIRPIRHFDRRSYKSIYGFFQYVEIDLGIMPKYRNRKYFILLIDAFSRRIFVEPLSNKTPVAIIKALNKIFATVKMKPYSLGSDRAGEFLARKTQNYFKGNKIHYAPKGRKIKAGLAEWAIYRVKKNLFSQMRVTKNKNWPDLIREVVNRINSIPLTRNKSLRPIDFNSPLDDVKVKPPVVPHWRTMVENQKKYEKSNNKANLHVGDCVKVDSYLLATHNAFRKETHERTVSNKSFAYQLYSNYTHNIVFIQSYCNLISFLPR